MPHIVNKKTKTLPSGSNPDKVNKKLKLSLDSTKAVLNSDSSIGKGSSRLKSSTINHGVGLARSNDRKCGSTFYETSSDEEDKLESRRMNRSCPLYDSTVDEDKIDRGTNVSVNSVVCDHAVGGNLTDNVGKLQEIIDDECDLDRCNHKELSGDDDHSPYEDYNIDRDESLDDDHKYLLMNDFESENEDFTPIYKSTRNQGGPECPDLSDFSPKTKKQVQQDHLRARKSWTDRELYKSRKESQEGLPGLTNIHTGVTSEWIRPMVVVEKYRLSAGQTFPKKECLAMRTAEEANLRGISIVTTKSDPTKFEVHGTQFIVRATYSKSGWKVHKAMVREEDIRVLEDDESSDDDNCGDEGFSGTTATNRSPFKSKWIAHLIQQNIAKTPALPLKDIREYLATYGNPYALTDTILQNAKLKARVNVFGTAKDNVRYVEGFVNELCEMGHVVEVQFTDKKRVNKMVDEVILYDKLRKMKGINKAMDTAERLAYVQGWREKYNGVINKQLKCDNLELLPRFVTGLFFATSTSKNTVPRLHKLIQADACHLDFGKYTLFSAYGTTANRTMSSVAFAIIFGNEDRASWTKFWKFALKVHPSINSEEMTIITDQDKGSIAALREVVPMSGHFHCSFHRRQNIIKKFGKGAGGSTNGPLKMFERLVSSTNTRQIKYYKDKYYPKMRPECVDYLEKVPDVQQYPAARCAMSHNIFMYGRSASSGGESMNRANKELRKKTAVDILNAANILLRLEGERFEKGKKNSWNHRENILTPKGLEEFNTIFDDDNIDAKNYNWTIVEGTDDYHCTVAKNLSSRQEELVRIPKMDNIGSRFGSCTCGTPQKDGLPCIHMVIVVKSNEIPNLCRTDIMPVWFKTALWSAQFPAEEIYRSNVTMQQIKEKYSPQHDVLYCPSWAAPNKAGRPKNSNRGKSTMDFVITGGKTKTSKRAKFCGICRRRDHTTENCFKRGGKSGSDEVDK